MATSAGVEASAEPESPMTSFTCTMMASGAAVPLKTPPKLDETIAVLRLRIARAIGGVPEGRVQLLIGGCDVIGEGWTLKDVLHSVVKAKGLTGDSVSVQVVVMKCNVRPAEYASCIKDNPEAVDIVGVVREFPAPTGLNINMMPFKILDPSSLPASCSQYWDLINQCTDMMPSFCRNKGEIWYLTVQEGEVSAGATQRRAGLHVECPGLLFQGDQATMPAWGLGHPGRVQRSGGIFMASNWSNTCRAWPCQVHRAAIGHLGDIDHLRESLPEGRDLQAGEIAWITDTTPHEALPVSEAGHRQFFRLVASEVSHWYSEHSTPNPLGIVPDPGRTKVVDDDKFAD